MEFYKIKTILDTEVGESFYINIECTLACRETQSFLVSLQALVYSPGYVNNLKDKSKFFILERVSSENQPDSFNIGFLKETKLFLFSEKAFNEKKKDPKFSSSLDLPVFQYLVFQDFDAGSENEGMEDDVAEKQEESLKNSDEEFKEILDDGLTKTPNQLDQEFEEKNNSSSNKQSSLEEGGQSLKKEQNLSFVKEKSEINEDLSPIELKKKLVEALAREDYEGAAQIRDLIEKKAS